MIGVNAAVVSATLQIAAAKLTAVTLRSPCYFTVVTKNVSEHFTGLSPGHLTAKLPENGGKKNDR